jgi:ribosomal protein S18 acetylase RimI-like enzyme
MKKEKIRVHNTMEIRYAVPADAKAIVSLTEAGFRKELLNAMIYGCNGVTGFLERQISIPLEIADTVYIIAESDDVVVGFVEFRIYSDSVFLNYIGTSPQARHKGLATKLLGQGLLMVRTKHHKRMSLDVFRDNIVAQSWYEKLGFTAEYNAGWYKLAQEEIDDSNNLQGRVSGYSQSNLCYDEFGFSQFNITTAKGSYSVGMLGQEWFRVTQSELLFDASALFCLNSIDINRSILGLFKENEQAKLPSGAVCFCRSIRMNIELDMFEKNIFIKKGLL